MSRRGPRRGLAIDDVVATATSVADARGLESLTMRTVAAELGVAAMTLYSYVPGKEELLDLMLDAVYLAMPRPSGMDSSWRDRVSAIAEQNRALFTTHPWAAQVATGRPPLGPGQMHKYEHELRAFDGLDLTDLDRDAALAHLLAFVAAHAREGRAALEARAVLDDQRWWAVAGPLLGEVLDPTAFPTAVRVGEAVGAAYGSAAEPQRAWRFGLAVVLDGLGTRFGLP